MTLLPVNVDLSFKVDTTNQGRTGLSADIDCLRANTAIDLDIFVGESSAKLSNLGNTAFDELLATAT